MVDGSTGDHLLDQRLNQRVTANYICKSLCHETVDEYEIEDCDKDYLTFLNGWTNRVDSSDVDVNAKLEDFRDYTDDNATLLFNWSDKEVDPVYRMFVQHLTEDGKAYKLEIPSVNGMKVYVKYEEREQEEKQEQSSPKNNHNRKRAGTTRILRSASKKKEIERPAKESPVPLFEKVFNLDCAKSISHGADGNSSTIPGTDLRSAKHLSQSDSDSNLIDEDYKTFLTDFFYDDDHRLIYMPVDSRSIVYEEDESTSDSELVMVDTGRCKQSRDSFGRTYSYSTMDVDSGKCLQSPGIRNGSNFRERLMKVLKRPYDQREYDYYLYEVSCRKPQVRHRELRRRVLKAYTVETYGKSYLHIYSELATKIQEVQYDRLRTLNLLRGFFYWLQNLSHEDAFRPWMDPSCLDVLPQS
ncbi:uncharacterized protein LOC120086550 [Benincasa hispida]|uniref:uncharacterized protein LOC120086550 n=1 Tax=Benincasa hispida TaxID=102211 RepID=UPI0018FF5FC2|nr:uncharacterized protein LOC120086550 [Benincasa hispida]